MDNKSMTFQESVNWEWVRSNHNYDEEGPVKRGAWLNRIIEHARKNGYQRQITEIGALRIINRNLR